MTYSKTIICGRLGKDPEMKFLPNGNAMTTFSVAVDYEWRDADGNKVEETTWYNVATYGKQAEKCNQYLHKGDTVLCEGRMRESRPYLGRDGEYHASLNLKGDVVRFLSTSGGGIKQQSEDDEDYGEVL